MRKLILNLHLYLALVAGIFVTILGVTGSILAFEDDLDRLSDQKLFYSAPHGNRLPAATILANLQKAYPGQRFTMVRLPVRPDGSYMTLMRGNQVFVDSYSGEIHGVRSGNTPLQTIHTLHMRLLMGKTGEKIVAYVGLIILFLLVSGIYLWWPLKRATVKPGAPARRLSFDLHNVVGIYSAAFLLALAITGTAIGFDEIVFTWLYDVTDSDSPTRTAPSTPQPGVARISPDDAIRIASDTLPGTVPIMFTLPNGPKTSYMVGLRFPEDLTPGGRSWVNVDQFSGKVVNVENSRTSSTATRVVNWNRAIHTGDILGYFSKTLMSLASLMLVVQVITGYYLWWKKLMPRKSSRRVETAAALPTR